MNKQVYLFPTSFQPSSFFPLLGLEEGVFSRLAATGWLGDLAEQVEAVTLAMVEEEEELVVVMLVVVVIPMLLDDTKSEEVLTCVTSTATVLSKLSPLLLLVEGGVCLSLSLSPLPSPLLVDSSCSEPLRFPMFSLSEVLFSVGRSSPASFEVAPPVLLSFS